MFKIQGSSNLNGEINISGSKNAALPIIAANNLTDNQINLKNVPEIKDVQILQQISKEAFSQSGNVLELTNETSSKIRASILLIPVGIIKYGKVNFCGSGGCVIGKRPLDTFEDALQQAGVKITQDKFLSYEKNGNPKQDIVLQEFSVTATEAIITYLSFLEDIDYEITVHQIAIEPHVINLIEFLRNIGANIQINFDHSITIKPQKVNIKENEFSIVGDYIEAGTYFAIGALAENSELTIKNFNIDDILSVLKIAKKIGINYEVIDKNTLKVNSFNKENYEPVKLQTNIHPGFPTDLQSIFGVILTQANGISKIFETLFEGRFTYLSELENLGAKIEILNPHQVIVIGPTPLKGDYVATTDLRGGGAMILAGIIAEGETYITHENIILRGYDNIEEKLKSIGVKIEKINSQS